MRSSASVESTPPEDSSQRTRAGVDAPAARIAWLQGAGPQREFVHRLERKFGEQGTPISFTVVSMNDSDIFPYYDLLILEYPRCNRRELARLITRIRRVCSAPIIVLSRCDEADLTVAALHAGADTVVANNTAEEVIVARCRALLRRWQPTRH